MKFNLNTQELFAIAAKTLDESNQDKSAEQLIEQAFNCLLAEQYTSALSSFTAAIMDKDVSFDRIKGILTYQMTTQLQHFDEKDIPYVLYTVEAIKNGEMSMMEGFNRISELVQGRNANSSNDKNKDQHKDDTRAWGSERPELSKRELNLTIDDVFRDVHFRADQKGLKVFSSSHETLGWIVQETQELSEAIHRGDTQEIINELFDVISASVWGITSLHIENGNTNNTNNG